MAIGTTRLGDETRARRRSLFVRGAPMQTYLLIFTEAGKLFQVAHDVAGIQGVTSILPIDWPYDVVALADVEDERELDERLLPAVRAVGGVIQVAIGPVPPDVPAGPTFAARAASEGRMSATTLSRGGG
jgi:DNA-binding Lrp family transcriptional regulator